LSALLFVPAPAGAILIETAPKQPPVGGYFLSEDATYIRVRIKTPDGKDLDKVYEKAKIKIIHRVKRDVLEKLSKDKPAAYRDYAIELAEWKADPEARELAQRLFLIAAYLDPNIIGSRCLLKMADMADNTGDVRKFRAMAFLLSPNGDTKLLQSDPSKGGTVKTKDQDRAFKAYQAALREYRSGQIDKAKAHAREDGVILYFNSGPMDQKAFLQACDDLTCSKCNFKKELKCTTCDGKGRVLNQFGGFDLCSTCKGRGLSKCTACNGQGVNALSEDQLRTIIRAEISALDQALPIDPAPDKASGSASWSRTLATRQISPAPALSLETITKFDPRKCLFRNGEWVAP
jgi:hypothetical protein